MNTRLLLLLAVSATLVLAGCGDKTITNGTATRAARTTRTSSSSSSATVATTPAAATTGDAVPAYKPSTVSSSKHIGGASKTVLTSPDSVKKVAAFYEKALRSGGWQAEKTTKSGDTVEYKAIKHTAAVRIEISSARAGASIAVKVIK